MKTSSFPFRRAHYLAALALLLLMATPLIAQTGLLGLWHFDEGAGSIGTDSLAAHNATLSGTQWTNGISGTGLRFTGGSSALLGYSWIIGKRASFTIEAWVNWSGAGQAGQQFIYSEGDGNDIIDLLLDNGVPKFTVLSDSWITAAGSGPLTSNHWHHLAGVLDPTGGKIYIDGLLAGTNSNMKQATFTPQG